MIHILLDSILPVFAILAIGFVMGRTGAARMEEARAINRISFLVLQPPLLLLLLARVDMGGIEWRTLGLYALCEALAFAISATIARLVFRLPLLEAWLVGMAVGFVNSLLYVGPIAALIYGPDGVVPITAIVALDSAVFFSFYIVSAQVMAGGDARAALPAIFRNPVLITIALAVAINLAGLTLPRPVLTAAGFMGAAAAPMTLFALGVTLSFHPVRPTREVATFAAAKLLGFPLLVAGVLAAAAPDSGWTPQVVLTAAGPSGAMAFALALLHGVETRTIAGVIIWTSALSLLSLAWLA